MISFQKVRKSVRMKIRYVIWLLIACYTSAYPITHDYLTIYWNDGRITTYQAKEYWTNLDKEYEFPDYSVYDAMAKFCSETHRREEAKSHCVADYTTSQIWYTDYIND